MADIQTILTELGPLRGSTSPELWFGASSLETRMQSSELTEQDVHEKIAYANTACFVPATPGAAKRCVEDRTEEGFAASGDIDAPLGPQVQGATADEAVAYRLTHNPDQAVSQAEDLAYVMSHARSDYKPGIHTGSYATTASTDCGSIDNGKVKLELLNDHAAAPVIEQLTAALLELNQTIPQHDNFQRLQDSAVQILHSSPNYFDQPTTLPALVKERFPEGYVHVLGDHKQIGLIVNMVAGTTFSPNTFNLASDGDITLHNLDLWNVFAEHEEPEQIALIAQAVTTLMCITDGSLRVYVRAPAPVLQGVA